MNLQNYADYGTLIELLPALRRTVTANGTGVDMRSYEGQIAVILASSAGGGTTPTLDVKLQESSDNSTWSDISGATFAQVTGAADSHEKITLQIHVKKRYLRAVATITGGSPTFDCVVLALAPKKFLT